MVKVPPDGDGHADGAAKRHNGSGDPALLLVESLIHHLVSRSILSVSEAIEIVDVAAEVEREFALTAGSEQSMAGHPSALVTMANSLRYELKE